MKSLLSVVVMLFFSVVVVAATNKLEPGDKAVLTTVEMDEVSGKRVSLENAKKENGLLVMFSCNQCPFVLAWEDRYNEIKEWADKNNVGMIVLNSNYQKRSGDDSFEAMQAKAKDKGYKFHYALDKDSRIANAYGGQTTPHVFIFDGNWKLAYKGAIDDSYKSAENVNKAYVKEALVSLGAGESIAVAETKPVGCSIKRKVE